MVALLVVIALTGAFMAVRARRRAAILDDLARRMIALEHGQAVRPILMEVGGPVGRLAGVFNSMAPVLEARIARLERDRQQLHAVLGGMTEGVLAIDERRRLVFANASADAIFGLGTWARGRLLPELIRCPRVQALVEATLAGSEPYQGEITLADREPSQWFSSRVLAVHGMPLPGPPATGAVFVFRDVTERKRLERMRQDFVANVSHELKTPLASIKAYAETLLDWALHDEEVNVRFLNRIEEQADRLNALILDLLSLARLESGDQVYDHEPLALAPVVASCVESHRTRVGAKGLTLTLDLGPLDPGVLVRADEESIRQILDNLIDNAIKYTPEGGSIRVSCTVTDGAIALEVADTGIGIPRDDLPRIFERFYRVDRARSREMGGTGLGLSIVKHMVQSLGGRVRVVSRLHTGSMFTIELPVYRAHVPGE